MKAETSRDLILITLLMLGIGTWSLMVLETADPTLYNQITGKATSQTKVNITPSPPKPCNATFYQGLNLISVPCIGDFEEVDRVFGNVSTLTAIFGYDKGSSDSWKVYNPNLPTWTVSDLAHLSKKEGYWLMVSSDTNYYFEGIETTSSTISISPGYNLLGYPKFTAEEISTSLQSINGSYSKVVSFNPITKTYETYIPGSGGALNETEPYRGYWINGTASDNWVIN